MPFTASHVMAVLPGIRWRRALRLDPTCLAIGAMAPDFQYFLWARREGEFSHSLVGLFAFDLPMTLVVAIAFHRLVKWLALAAAPQWLARRCAPFAVRAWRPHVAIAIASALIGSATHLAWDGFTHGPGFAVVRSEFLVQFHDVPLWGRLPMHRILQHVSTVIGGLAVLGYLALALRRTPPAPPRADDPRWTARLALGGFTAVVFAVLFVRLWRRGWIEPGNVAVIAISAVLAGALLASVLLWRQLDAMRVRSPAGDRDRSAL